MTDHQAKLNFTAPRLAAYRARRDLLFNDALKVVRLAEEALRISSVLTYWSMQHEYNYNLLDKVHKWTINAMIYIESAASLLKAYRRTKKV